MTSKSKEALILILEICLVVVSCKWHIHCQWVVVGQSREGYNLCVNRWEMESVTDPVGGEGD